MSTTRTIGRAMPPERVTYILVDESLSAPQVAVQAVHAAQSLAHEKGALVGDTSVVICTVSSGMVQNFYNLTKHNLSFLKINYKSAMFFEPPQQKYTACAFLVDNNVDARRPFRRFRLYK